MEGELTVPIYYEDTDFSGSVYHANYLKFFDRAREELLGRKKLREIFDSGRHFVVKDLQLTFHKPVTHGDEVVIKSRIDFNHAVIVKCHHVACRKSDGEKVVSGVFDLVIVNERGFPIRVPQEFSQS